MKKSIYILLLIVTSGILLFSIWKLFGILTNYQEGEEGYEALDSYISIPETTKPADTANPEQSDESAAANTAPETGETAWPVVDFQQLKEINPDIVAWIYIESTGISYPVVQGTDNDYYLNRLFDGTDNSAGCVFLDANCAGDFSDPHSILYGHHLYNGSMFSKLLEYKKQKFYDGHPTALLMTPTTNYKIRFFSGYVSESYGSAWEKNFIGTDFALWLEEISSKSCFSSAFAPEDDDLILTLSTCSYEFDDARFVIHGYVEEQIDLP